MREVLLRIPIGLVTFLLGISSVFVFKVATGSSFPAEDLAVFRVIPINRDAIPRFMPTGRGCGGGYAQGYRTNDGEAVVEGVAAGSNSTEIKRELRKWVRDAEQVIERLPKFRDHRGNVGERIVIVNKPGDSGKESVSIIFYGGGDYYRFIDAPSLDLALEFEQYLIRIDFKSPV
jgi:hypothetical protein